MDDLYLNNSKKMLLIHMPVPHSPIPKPSQNISIEFYVLLFEEGK